MFKVVIKGKEISLIKIMHLGPEMNFIIYDEDRDKYLKNQIIFFDDEDIDDLIITVK